MSTCLRHIKAIILSLVQILLLTSKAKVELDLSFPVRLFILLPVRLDSMNKYIL